MPQVPRFMASEISIGRASCDSMAASEGRMRPKKHETTREDDLFRARLDGSSA